MVLNVLDLKDDEVNKRIKYIKTIRFALSRVKGSIKSMNTTLSSQTQYLDVTCNLNING